jgi:hypothetical protein
MGGQKIQAKMSNSTGPETPLQEAVSIISIISILASVGCYVAALNQIPVITQGLRWVAVRVYEFWPALATLPGTQVPVLAAGAAVGLVFFVFTIPSPTGWRACSPVLGTRAWTARQGSQNASARNVKTTQGTATIIRLVDQVK